MGILEKSNYWKIAEIIDFVRQSGKAMPNYDFIEKTFHKNFERLNQDFNAWVGIAPDQFFQLLSKQQSSVIQRDDEPLLFEEKTGQPQHQILHSDFVQIVRMTDDEFNNQAIHFSFSDTPFGQAIIASTKKGICYLAFEKNNKKAIKSLQNDYRNSIFEQKTDEKQQNALKIFQNDGKNLSPIKLHLKGTDFQVKVWEALLKIPYGTVTTYQKLATSIGRPDAPRATGTAMGTNLVAYIIPCHRVIPSTGGIGNFKWGGTTRKMAIIGWEAAKNNLELKMTNFK